MDKINMSQKKHAFVLRFFKNDNKRIILFDKDKGKIIGDSPQKNIPIGACIEYDLIVKRKKYILYNTRIVLMPVIINQDDLLFLHQVLELCHYFMPEEMPEEDIFSLLIYLYDNMNLFNDPFSKKIYITKLLLMFGIYPEKPYIEKTYWQDMLQQPISLLLRIKSSKEVEEFFIVWIRSCIQMHPLSHTFKAIKL